MLLDVGVGGRISCAPLPRSGLTRVPVTAATLFPKVTSPFCSIGVRSDCRATTAFLALAKLRCVPEPSISARRLGRNVPPEVLGAWLSSPVQQTFPKSLLQSMLGREELCLLMPDLEWAEVRCIRDHHTANGASMGKKVAAYLSPTSCHLLVTSKI